MKATWSDSSDDEKSEKGNEDEEVNLYLMANYSNGEYDIGDASLEDLQRGIYEVEKH